MFGTFSPLLNIILVGSVSLMATSVTRYWMLHQAGYWVFLPLVVAGAVFMIVANKLVSIPYISEWKLNAALVAVVLSLVTAGFANMAIGKNRSLLLAARFRGNLAGVLMHDAWIRSMLVEVTVETGKAYVGFVLSSGVATSNDSDASIIPLMSGYRSNDTQELKLTTYYAGTLKEARQSGSRVQYDEFEVVLPKRCIVSVRRFDLDTYANKDFSGGVAPATPTV